MWQEFQRIGRYLFQEGLIDSHGGNLSVLAGDKILITRRDAMLGDLKEGDIITVGLEPGSNDDRAARELPAHRALYKQTRHKAIVHAHPANAIAISLTDNKVVPQDAAGLSLYKAASILRVRTEIGSDDAARMLPQFLNSENVVVMVKGHGSFAVGQNLEEAYRYTSCVENSCKIIVAVRASGGRPAPRKEAIMDHPRKRSTSAIPPGIGVMDRSRERGRFRR